MHGVRTHTFLWAPATLSLSNPGHLTFVYLFVLLAALFPLRAVPLSAPSLRLLSAESLLSEHHHHHQNHLHRHQQSPFGLPSTGFGAAHSLEEPGSLEEMRLLMAEPLPE
jgi:hypothetical protein